MTAYDRVLPLISGEVKPAGITLEYQGMPGEVPGVYQHRHPAQLGHPREPR
jgi:hypothetical protein